MKKLSVMLLVSLFAVACFARLPEVPTLNGVELPTVNEETEIWASADYANKPVLVVFMGSWCPWCKRTLPALNALQEKYGNQIEIVGVFMDSTPGPVHDVLQEHDAHIKALFNGSEVAEGMGVSGLPHAILFNKNHQAIKAWEGFSPTLEEEFDEQVKRVL
jgi:thiol-disulfide isomerase/thioredoxin